MKPFNNFLAIVSATAWISLSEFFRNEILFKSLWVNHYQKLGLVFPEETGNKIAWVGWSLMLTGLIYNIAKKFSLAGTTLLSWFAAFAMMWIVIGNLGVLPHKLMLYATPLSLLETFVATLIIQKISDRHP